MQARQLRIGSRQIWVEAKLDSACRKAHPPESLSSICSNPCWSKFWGANAFCGQMAGMHCVKLITT